MLKKNLSMFVGLGALIVIGLLFIIALVAEKKEEQVFITYPQFIEMVEAGTVTSVTLSDGPVIVFETGSGIFETDNPRREDLKESLLVQGIHVEEGRYRSGYDMIQSGVGIVVFSAAALFTLRYINKNNGQRAMGLNVQESQEDVLQQVCFDQIAGNEEAKEGVADLVDFIKTPEKYTQYGARMPKGVLFYGPPGTGKTLMAKAIAGEAGVPFFAVSGSDFVQMYVGVGAGRVRELFRKAREKGKAVIFIDEIDAIGKTRSATAVGGNDERDQTLNALLTEMSGFSSGEGIVVIGATNRLDTIDEALLRPGRFDRQVEIGLPDLNSRKRILALHTQNKPLADSIGVEALAKQTVFFSGAMLENLVNEAAINAAKKDAGYITQEDVDKAYYTVVAGSEKKDRSQIKEQDRRITAYHESGHGLATKLLAPENTVAKITIVPSTKGAGGFCVNIPPDKMYYTKKELENQVMILLAGRGAEEVVFGEEHITTGASNDLEKATSIIQDYVSKYGMSKTVGLGPVSDDILHAEYRVLMQRLYQDAKELIEAHRDTLNKIAAALLEKESLNEEELDAIIQQDPECFIK